MKKYSAQAFTLIEMIVVVALIGIAIIPLVRNARQSTQIQGLRTSVSVFSDDLQSVKVSSREARNKKAWGIISQVNNSYMLVEGTPQSYTVSLTRSLERGTTFEEPFQVWFEIGTGNTSSKQIELRNESGKRYMVSINDIGTISISDI